MKYLKRLKNELSDLTTRLRGQVFDNVPSSMGNRARALQSLVVLVREAKNIDHATDHWDEDNAQEWFTYLGKLEVWLASMPKGIPERVESRSAAE
jgi:hypothetical protein